MRTPILYISCSNPMQLLQSSHPQPGRLQWQSKLDAVIETLDSMEIDLLMGQETWQDEKWSLRVPDAWQLISAPHPDRGRTGRGLLLLFRRKMLERNAGL